jgi:hypothetical protein
VITDLNVIVKEWAYRVHDGKPDPNNSAHLYHLSEILIENKWPLRAIDALLQNLKEVDRAGQVWKTKMGNWRGERDDGTRRSFDNKDLTQRWVSGEEDPEGEEPSIDTKVAIEKLNDPRFGVEAKIDTALKKGYIEQGDADNMREFQTDMEDFLKNPTQEKAEALVEKYKLSQNPNGKKLYVGIIAGNSRKILGEGNALVNELSEVLNKFVPLKELGNKSKKAQDKLAGASKPGLKTIRKSDDDDPGVKKLFSNPPYDRLKERFHQVFGPIDNKGNLLRPSSKYSTEYFRQSVSENESLDNTIEVLKELESQGIASPGVRKSLERHKKRMQDIAKNFNNMKPEERRAAVEQSYSDMAREMHNADPDMARGLMKNMAEMALYDSELAGGDEVYLPSDGSFPSADKMRVDRDGKGVVEKVAGVSVKFGKNGAVYGFPGESSQYQKFHPDEDKRTHMRNRVGHKGHALGVRDDLIQNKSKFNKMLKESGLSETIKNPEVVRTKLLEIQEKINKLRSQVEDENGKYTKKDLVKIRKQLEEANKEAIDVLNENVDVEKLEEIMGKANAREFMKGGAHAINIIAMASVLNTSDGLSVLEHNHQTIDKDGLHSETDKGTANLKDWDLKFRGFDNRGGGLICGFIGGSK